MHTADMVWKTSTHQHKAKRCLLHVFRQPVLKHKASRSNPSFVWALQSVWVAEWAVWMGRAKWDNKRWSWYYNLMTHSCLMCVKAAFLTHHSELKAQMICICHLLLCTGLLQCRVLSTYAIIAVETKSTIMKSLSLLKQIFTFDINVFSKKGYSFFLNQHRIIVFFCFNNLSKR